MQIKESLFLEREMKRSLSLSLAHDENQVKKISAAMYILPKKEDTTQLSGVLIGSFIDSSNCCCQLTGLKKGVAKILYLCFSLSE